MLRYCPRCGTHTDAATCESDGTPTVRHGGSGRGQLGAGDVVGGRYRLCGELGRGGFGVVFDAVHTTTGHPVAVKILTPTMGDDGQEMARRFFHEAATTSRLSHPNTVRVYDFGQTDSGDLFLAMERLSGETLLSRLNGLAASEQIMSEQETVETGVAILRSLGEAHALGLVHRDMKPANVFLHQMPGGDSILKVLDFGIVKDSLTSMTQAGKALGTPTHMSPEQAMGKAVDGRADIYALGVVLYECLTGSLPFWGDSPLTVVMKHVTEPVPPIASRVPGRVRRTLASVVEKAMAKKPHDRWQTALEMRNALQAALNEPALPPLPPSVRVVGAVPVEDREERLEPTPIIAPVAPLRHFPGLDGPVALPDPAAVPHRVPAADWPPAPEPLPFSADTPLADSESFSAWQVWSEEDAAPAPHMTSGSVHEMTPAPPFAIHRPLVPQQPEQGPRWEPPAPRVIPPSSGAFEPRPVVVGKPDAMSEHLLQTLQQMTRAMPVRPQQATAVSQATAMWLAEDGRRALYGDQNGAVRMVDLAGLGEQPVSLPDMPHQTEVGHHATLIVAVAGSPDGRLAASASVDGVVRVWDPAGGQMLAEAPLQSPVTCMAAASDGKLLVVGCEDGSAWLLEFPQLTVRRTLHGHRDPLTAVAAAGSRRLVATASEQGTIRTWDPVGGGARLTFRGHEGAVGAVAVAHNGQWLASGGWDGQLLLWSARTGELVRKIPAHADVIAGLCIDRDGKVAVTASDDRKARVWNLETGELLAERQDFRAGARFARLLADGSTAVAGSWDGTFRRLSW